MAKPINAIGPENAVIVPAKERIMICKSFYDNQGILTLLLFLKKYSQESRRICEATIFLLLQIIKYDERCYSSFVSCNGVSIVVNTAKYLSLTPALRKVYDYYFDDRNMVQAHALLIIYKLKACSKDKVSKKVTNVECLDFTYKMLHRHTTNNSCLPIQFAAVGYLYEMCKIFKYNYRKRDVLLDAKVDVMLLNLYHNFVLFDIEYR